MELFVVKAVQSDNNDQAFIFKFALDKSISLCVRKRPTDYLHT